MSESKYRPVTAAIIAELKGIVGERYVIHDDVDALESFSHDEVAETEYAHMPEVVVRPRTAEEISAIIKLANREMIPVTPRGAGSGLSGGAVPLHGGIVIATDRMNEILEVDPENLMMVLEPGVVTREINEILADYGLFYAGYPMSLETCYIGGNVAENAGGGKAVKYGVTGRYVMGLEMVTPTGEIVRLGGKRVKDVTGYNLLGLMVGSEGTLGVFTKVTLKLLPLAKSVVDLLVLFKTPEEAIAVVPEIMTAGGIIPTAIEFMDRSCVKVSCEYLNESLPWRDAGAMLIITFDGADEEAVLHEYETAGDLCYDAGAIEVYVADNYTTSERIWRVRRNIPEAWKQYSPHRTTEDIVVPVAAIPEMLSGIAEIAEKYGTPIPCYGHAGDGNLHAKPIMNPQWSVERWRETLPEILTDMYRLTSELGGTISGEHGIGHKRKKYMPLVCSPEHIEMMRAVKRALDPNNILNPGKIFDV